MCWKEDRRKKKATVKKHQHQHRCSGIRNPTTVFVSHKKIKKIFVRFLCAPLCRSRGSKCSQKKNARKLWKKLPSRPVLWPFPFLESGVFLLQLSSTVARVVTAHNFPGRRHTLMCMRKKNTTKKLTGKKSWINFFRDDFSRLWMYFRFTVITLWLNLRSRLFETRNSFCFKHKKKFFFTNMNFL